MICENQKKKKVIKNVLGIMLLWLSACTQQTQEEITQEVIDLSEIRDRNSLIVSIDHNSVDYFIYKGEPMGFQYEILSELGKHLGLKVDIQIGKSYADNLQSLSEGRCDMIVSGLIANIDSSKAANSEMLYQDQKVLIQRKPESWRKMTTEQVEQVLVRDPEDLNGKMVYTSGWSPLENNADFIDGRHIKFVTLREIEPEALINLVEEGELDYAACKYSIARLIMERYPNLDMQTQLGELPIGWVVRPTSSELLGEINQWLDNFRKTNKYAVLYKKYHESRTLLFNVNTKYFASRTGVISEYDDLFKKYSVEIGWDWRLLASLVCQESKFKPEARSRKGAYGLMQMMPSTLEFFGIDTTASPEKHIAAGVKYIKYLDKMLSETISDTEERIKFVLASYNIGPGHVMDAQRLAEKYGKDATVWDNNVDSCLLNKADPKYYKDPEVRHGRCKGKETYAFVVQIMKRYEHYKNIDR
ncbi:MAG: transporter substrate-binding domain-containing protein [Bacteroidales bacterium]|jgi:membrane-bound lytic murein transglycosylase F|nr:transporter substrate-binding domain-containing protein [Bacteroidales bacterium]